MFQDPLAADLVVPVKFSPLAVTVTPASGVLSSPRRKPLMLFWKLVLDGDGVGDGVVACDAGATMSRRAATAAKTAPTAVVILPRRRGGRPRVVLLKGENLHVGMVWVAPLQPLRTFGGRVEPVVRC